MRCGQVIHADETPVVEAPAREQGFDAHARAELRRVQAKPELDSLLVWLTDTRVNVAPGSATGKAIDYKNLPTWPNSRIDELLPLCSPRNEL